MPNVRRLDDILSLRRDYDAFLIDVWGVLHRGESLFDGVTDVLEELAASGARVVFLSNSSKLGVPMADGLVALGVRRELFAEVVSSGDVTRAVLEQRAPEVFGRFKTSPRVLHVGNPGFVPWLFELGLTFCEVDADADLVVVSGMLSNDTELAGAKERLAPLVARGVPLVCTNPDRLIPTGRALSLGPGAVAGAYASLGGETFLYGKPHAPIYREALARLGVDVGRVVAIGDMIETDIVGARGASIASVLVTSGVHLTELGETPDDDAIDALSAKYGAAPDAVIAHFGRRSPR